MRFAVMMAMHSLTVRRCVTEITGAVMISLTWVSFEDLPLPAGVGWK